MKNRPADQIADREHPVTEEPTGPEHDGDHRLEEIARLRQEITRLHASERRLLDFATASSDWRWETDADLCFTYISDSFFRATGLRREQIIGTNRIDWLRHGPPDPRLTEHFEDLRAGRPFRDVIVTQYHAEDSLRYIKASGIAVYDDEGKFQGYRGTGVDVTDQITAAGAMRRLEQQLNALLQHSPGAIYVKDPEQRFLMVNPVVEKLTGQCNADLTGRRAEEVFAPELARRLSMGDAQVIECNERINVQYIDDTSCVLIHKFPIFDEHGQLAAIGGIETDITEHRRAADALERQSGLLQAVFDHIPDGLLYANSDGVIEMANPGAARIHGTELATLVGKHCSELYDREVWSGTTEPVADDSVEPELVALRRADGTAYSAEVIAAPVENSAHEFIGFVTLERDVTARESAKVENAQLAEQLQQAQKMQSLGQLTGGIAHDFNNILASILGFTGLAQSYCNDDPQNRLGRYLREIELAGGRARDLVKQMLAFGRASPGAPKTVDLGTKVAGSMTLLKSTLSSSIEFITHLESTLWVRVDPVQFDQVLMNLVINARDAMDGRGKIYLALRAVNETGLCTSCAADFGGEFVELTVSDQGPGVPNDVRERMFEPFFTTKDVGQGTGMGLSTVHGIVHEHGGHIIVDSRGAGFTIKVLLPRGRAPATMTDAPATPSPEPGQSSRLRILAVDDERSVGQFLKELLEMHGHEVNAFASTSDALAWYAQHHAEVDVVVSDLTMPDTPGELFIAELRKLRPALPAVVTSGIGEAEKHRRLAHLEACQIVDKPIEPSKLLEALSDFGPDRRPTSP